MSRKERAKTRALSAGKPGVGDKEKAMPSQGIAGFPPLTWRPGWPFGLLLVAATIIAYQPALRGRFVWDDDSWTTKIPNLLRDLSGLQTIWRDPTALQQYYPLTGTTFWLDYHLWGFWTLPYHVENVLLHACAALVFWRLLRRLQVPGAWLASAVFAIHPIMVESAGWITERKNVLSLVLYLAALLAYGRFTGFWQADVDPAVTVNESQRRRWGAYALAFLLFLGAFLAKATAFSLPAVILLFGWWKRGRLRWRAEGLPALPFFALSLGLGLVTAWLENHHVGAKGPDWAISFPERCLIAGHAFWFYLAQLLWPVNLCFVYPRWQLNSGSLSQWLYPVAAIGTLLALWMARARIGRGPAAAVFFFAGTLFPVLGFMNAYGMRYAFVWDHWVYLSSLGIMALGAGLVLRLAERLGAPGLLYGFAAVVLPVLGALTWQQSKMYTDIETLWRTTLAKNPSAFIAHNNLGNLLLQRERVDEAIAHYQKALQIQPNYADAHYNLGSALQQKGEPDAAVQQFQEAIRLDPAAAFPYNGLGKACALQGKLDDAMNLFSKAIKLDPGLAGAHHNLGNAYMIKGKLAEAIAEFKTALRLKPDHIEVEKKLADALLQTGNAAEAIPYCEAVVKAEPQDARAHFTLGSACLAAKRLEQAVASFKEALRLTPDTPECMNALAWIYATSPRAELRNGAEAVRLAEKACKLTQRQKTATLDTLAAAYAEAGRFDEAVKTTEEIRALATSAHDTNTVETARQRLELYQAGKAYRDE